MDSEKRDKEITVPFIAYERAEAAFERNIKRLWITIILLIALLFASNMAWVWFMYGTDFELYSADIDAGENGDALYNYIGDHMEGNINNGTYTSEAEEDYTVRRPQESDSQEG